MKRIYLMLALMLSVIMSGCKPEIEEPTVVTKSVKEITDNSAKVVGQVVADGGAEVTERGICWSADGTPTILDYRVKDADGGLGTFTSNLSDLDANTTYCVRVYAKNSAGISYGEEMIFTTLNRLEEYDGEISGHAYVDLGLSSGLKWATCNIGANNPEDYGDYFAWGETITKTEYTSSNSGTCELSISQLQSQGYVDGGGNLTSSHDAATANWGGTWRLPTKEE